MSNISRAGLVVLAVIIAAVAFGGGYIFGASHTSPGGDELGVIRQAWDTIYANYFDPDSLDAEALTQGAIKGMLEALDDPYTSYLEAELYELGITGLEGEFDGIGAYVAATEDEEITIIAPIAGSPAEAAGIRAGDVILAIDGQSTQGIGLAKAIVSIRGPQGTDVTLSVRHAGETEPVDITIVRGHILIPSVDYEMRGDIAYIVISEFTSRTDDELADVLAEADAAGAAGIVLDLRGNPGGLLDTVVAVASHFIADGAVVMVRYHDEDEETLDVIPGTAATDLPMVALVNGASASGSEVLAGALQDHDRALIAGSVTFGKGSVNTLRQLSDGSGIYITIARWLTPDGRLIEGQGIEPDVPLDLTGEAAVDWAIDYLHDNS